MLEKLKRFNTDEWWERGYLIIFGIILTHHFLDTTMFQIPWPPKTGLVLYFLIMVYTLAKLIWKRTDYSRKELIGSAVILFAFIMSAVISDYSFLFEIAFLIVGAKNVSFDKILKLFCTIGITIMVAAFVASQAGWIENLVYETWQRGTRSSFGIVYPTDFAAHIFYLILAWLCIDNKKLKIQHIVVPVLAALFIFKACAAYTSSICFIFFAFLAIIAQVGFEKKGRRDIILRISTLSSVVIAITYIAMTHLYSKSSDILMRINDYMSNRIELSARGVQEFGYTLFGQFIPEIGNGGTTEYNPEYFYLDDSYIRIALEYGILVLLIVLIIWIVISNRAINTSRNILLVALVMITIHCFMEQHLLEIAYNPFILALFADLQVRSNYVQKDK